MSPPHRGSRGVTNAIHGPQLEGTAKITNTNGATCLSLVWCVWCVWCVVWWCVVWWCVVVVVLCGGGGVVWWWWRCVVVVLTVKLMTCLWRYVITDAPNYGGRVPVDTTPGPAPVCRALKNRPHIPAVKTDSWNLSLRLHSDIHTAQELLRHVVRNNGRVNDETGTATVGATVICTPGPPPRGCTTSTTGTSITKCTATEETLGSQGPWRTASA